MYYLVKIKYPVQSEHGSTKKEAINMLVPAINYSDAEVKAHNELEMSQINGFEITGITTPKYDELHFRTQESIKDESMYWWKTRMKYMSESENGKMTAFYVTALIYAEDVVKAVELAEEKMNGSIKGEVDSCVATTINHVVFSDEISVSEEDLKEKLNA